MGMRIEEKNEKNEKKKATGGTDRGTVISRKLDLGGLLNRAQTGLELCR